MMTCDDNIEVIKSLMDVGKFKAENMERIYNALFNKKEQDEDVKIPPLLVGEELNRKISGNLAEPVDLQSTNRKKKKRNKKKKETEVLPSE